MSLRIPQRPFGDSKGPFVTMLRSEQVEKETCLQRTKELESLVEATEKKWLNVQEDSHHKVQKMEEDIKVLIVKANKLQELALMSDSDKARRREEERKVQKKQEKTQKVQREMELKEREKQEKIEKDRREKELKEEKKQEKIARKILEEKLRASMRREKLSLPSKFLLYLLIG
ncbi:unnamed protein product [Pleuronectes platessa]|uniref:Uncharacterized protein n=1 Tax=Pleuronectes platessa TaxID=8262 RepID=A0A9N7V103_PLEPL|nr:unnamed protein product [Pleuronectes platessa]